MNREDYHHVFASEFLPKMAVEIAGLYKTFILNQACVKDDLSIRNAFSQDENQQNKSKDPRQTNSPKRNCAVCKKKPVQVQCLHCSEHVCMECAQQHVNLVGQESDGVMHLLNEKLDILDRIAVDTRQRIVAERDKIVQQADAERDRSFALLTQMIEEEKQRIRNKNKELNDLPLNEIPIFIRQLNSDVQHLTDATGNFFKISSSAPRITLRRRNEQGNVHSSADRSKFEVNDDWGFSQSRDERRNKKSFLSSNYGNDDVDREYIPQRRNQKLITSSPIGQQMSISQDHEDSEDIWAN